MMIIIIYIILTTTMLKIRFQSGLSNSLVDILQKPGFWAYFDLKKVRKLNNTLNIPPRSEKIVKFPFF